MFPRPAVVAGRSFPRFHSGHELVHADLSALKGRHVGFDFLPWVQGPALMCVKRCVREEPRYVIELPGDGPAQLSRDEVQRHDLLTTALVNVYGVVIGVQQEAREAAFSSFIYTRVNQLASLPITDSEVRMVSYVALVAHPGAEMYGSDRVLLESIEGMVSAGASVVVTLPADGPLAAELRKRGVPVLLCPTPVLRKSLLTLTGLGRFVWDSLVGLIASIRMISAVKPDIIYVNTVTIPLWNLVGRIRSVPVLLHVHEADGSTPVLTQRILAFPVLAARNVVANSHYTAGVLEAAFGQLRRKTTVLYNGVAGPHSVRAPRRLVEGPLRILFVGRLSPRKGIDVLMESLAILRRRGLEAELDIVGAVFPGYEWFEEELRDLVRLNNLEGCVRFHGFQSRVWPFLAAADVAVVPSRLDESFGNTAVEALLAARPLIVSETSGLLEAAAGYTCVQFVPPGSPEAIAEALHSLAANWARFRSAALRDASLAADRHDLRRYQRGIAGLIRETVNRN